MVVNAEESTKAKSTFERTERSTILCRKEVPCTINALQDSSVGHGSMEAMLELKWNDATRAASPYDTQPYQSDFSSSGTAPGWIVEWEERMKGSENTVGSPRFSEDLLITCSGQHACEALEIHCPASSKCALDCSASNSNHVCGADANGKRVRMYVHPNAPFRIAVHSGWPSAVDNVKIELYWAFGSRLLSGEANPCAGLPLGHQTCAGSGGAAPPGVRPGNALPCAPSSTWNVGKLRLIPFWTSTKNTHWNCANTCLAQATQCVMAAPTNLPTSAPTSNAPTASPTTHAPTSAPTQVPTQEVAASAVDGSCAGTGEGFFSCEACRQIHALVGVESDVAKYEGCRCLGSIAFDDGQGARETLSFCLPRDGFATTDPALTPPVACAPPADRCLGPTNGSDVLAFFQEAYWARGRAAPLSTSAVWSDYLCSKHSGSCDGSTGGAICAPEFAGKLCSGCAEGHFRDTGGVCSACVATDPVRAIGVPILVFLVFGSVVFIAGVLIIFALVLCKNTARFAMEKFAKHALARERAQESGHNEDETGEEKPSVCVQLCPSPGAAIKDAAQFSLWSVLQLQLVATTASAFAGRAPEWMMWFYSALRIAFFVVPNSNSACVAAFQRDFPFAKQEALFSMTLFVLFVSALMCNTFFRIESCLQRCSSCKSCSEEGEEEEEEEEGGFMYKVKDIFTLYITPYFRLAMFMFLNVGYAYITMTALESVDCVHLQTNGGSDDGALWLERRPETRCWADSVDGNAGAAHWPLGVLALLTLVLYSVCYPICSLLFVYWQFFYKPSKNNMDAHNKLDSGLEGKEEVGMTIEMTAVSSKTKGDLAQDISAMAFVGATREIEVAARQQQSAHVINPISAAPALPDGWEQQYDPATESYYYEHVESGATQWGRPACVEKGTKAEWISECDAQKGKYFYNTRTGQSSWELPEGALSTSAVVAGQQGAGEESSEVTARQSAEALRKELDSPSLVSDFTEAPHSLTKSNKLMRSMLQIGLVKPPRPPSVPRERLAPPSSAGTSGSFKDLITETVLRESLRREESLSESRGSRRGVGDGRRHSINLDVRIAIERKGKRSIAYQHFFGEE